jgi:hypothetical protein
MLVGGSATGINNSVDVRPAGPSHAGPVRRVLWPSAALALVAIAAGASPAAASEPLAPGETRETVVELPAGWTDQADRLGVSIAGLAQQENGCLDPEVRAGDTSCGPADGDLAEQLTATVAAGVLTDGSCVVPGAAATLSLLDTAVTHVSVSRASCLSLRLDFDDTGDDDNLAQSDTLSFSLQIVAEGPGGVEGSGGSPTTVVQDVDTAGPASAAGPAAGGAAAAGARVAGRVAAAAAGPAVAPGTVADGATAQQQPSAVKQLGRIESQVSLGDDPVAVQTEASSTSLTQLIVLWGSLLVGAVLVGWSAFLVRRRRRQGRAA